MATTTTTTTTMGKFPSVNEYNFTSLQSRYSNLEKITLDFEKQPNWIFITKILGEAFTLERDIIWGVRIFYYIFI